MNYDKPYALLKAKKDTLKVVRRTSKIGLGGKPLIMNETVHRRVQEFPQADELSSKIAENVANFKSTKYSLIEERIWQ